MGVSGTELEALRIVEQSRAEFTAHAVSRKLRTDPNYARLMLTSLAKKDYLDLLASGRYRMTQKGRDELKRRNKSQDETDLG